MKKNPDINHLELLPREDAPLDFALDMLMYSNNRYYREGLLQAPHFLEHFMNRWYRILNATPNDSDFSRTAQIEFAFIANELYSHYNIDLYSYIRRIDAIIDQAKDEKDKNRIYFTKLQETGIQLKDLENTDLIVQFLDFLYTQSQNNIDASCNYIRTCIDLTQLSGGMEIFDKHIKLQLMHIDSSKLDEFMESNSYLGQEDIDDRIALLMSGNDMSYIQASNAIGIQEHHYAGLHVFMDEFHHQNIRPFLSGLSIQERNDIGALLNDFRDILDPTQRIPDSFISGYSHEIIERENILSSGRNLH